LLTQTPRNGRDELPLIHGSARTDGKSITDSDEQELVPTGLSRLPFVSGPALV